MLSGTSETMTQSNYFVFQVFCVCLFIVSVTFHRVCFAVQPNIVILFADDLGYGDLPSYGHPTSDAPVLESLLKNGLRFTDFYAANPVCTPSRASLLTGRQPPRTGMYPGVLYPQSVGGLPLEEITIAELLKPLNYRTALVGKWHLGVGENNKYMPTNQGFDYYYGIPYTHDMCPCVTCFYPNDTCYYNCNTKVVSCPLFENTTIIQQPADFVTLADDLVIKAKQFIAESASSKQPFFLYYAFYHTHNPQFAGKQFRNSTVRGAFGDSLAEMDWSIGEVMAQLRDSGVEENTFVFFSSDNGPCLIFPFRAGSAGLLKCGKGTTYEGGQRVPGIAYWPGRIKPGVTREMASTLDLFPTIANITGATLPNVTLDGVDMSPILFGQGKGNRETFFYYPSFSQSFVGVYAVRYKQYKAHFLTQGNSNSGAKNHDEDCRPSAGMKPHAPPLLYDLYEDASEQFSLTGDASYHDVLSKIYDLKVKYEANMDWRASEIAKGFNASLEPCCNPGCEPFPACCQCSSLSHSKQKYLRFVPGS